MQKRLTCINCPIGCELNVVFDGENVIQRLEGNQCGRGKLYAQNELTNPTRTVTSTVRVAGAALAQLPVKTSAPVRKEKIMECMCALKGVSVCAPVAAGEVIVKNICNTGSDVVATRSVGKL